MGVKNLIFPLIALVLIIGCTADKTKPIVTDLTETETQNKVQKETPEINKTIPESTEETELNESEEEKEEELPSGTYIITIKDLKLEPQELTIKQGETVIWKHEDKWQREENIKHLLHQYQLEFRSPSFFYGQEFNHTFNKTGIFTYFDVIYPERDFMRGKIVVE